MSMAIGRRTLRGRALSVGSTTRSASSSKAVLRSFAVGRHAPADAPIAALLPPRPVWSSYRRGPDMTDAPILTDLMPEGADMPDPEDVHGWVASYFEGTRGGDAARWASAFADGGVVDDPVGTPVKDTPQAIMQMGKGFLAAFETVGLHESFVHVVGFEAVARWHGRGITRDGQKVTFEGINHFTFNKDGKITLLRGFFTPPGS